MPRSPSRPAQMCLATRGTLLTSLALRGDSEDHPGLKAVALIERPCLRVGWSR